MNARKAVTAVILMMMLAGICCAQDRSDAVIRTDLQRRIQPGIGVTVSVQNGIVTLSGTASSLAQKLSVINLARRTIGVRDVVDRITVVPAAKRTDAEIAQSVRSVLVGNLSKEELASVNVQVANGVVTLTGSLNNSYPKQVAGVLASWVPGVVDVRNEINVKPSQVRSDIDIIADLRARFQKNPFIAQQRINISVTNGVVTLNGIADNFLAAEQAEAVARFTPGVVEVRNLLYVRAMAG